MGGSVSSALGLFLLPKYEYEFARRQTDNHGGAKREKHKEEEEEGEEVQN